MHHFEQMQPDALMLGPSIQPQTDGPRTFRDEYNGVLTGLMSGIQFGYAGISMIYFFQNIKTVIEELKSFFGPILKKIAGFLNPKVAILWMLKKLVTFLKLRSASEAVFKILLMVSFAVLIDMYLRVKTSTADLLETQERKRQDRTSQEFWQ